MNTLSSRAAIRILPRLLSANINSRITTRCYCIDNTNISKAFQEVAKLNRRFLMRDLILGSNVTLLHGYLAYAAIDSEMRGQEEFDGARFQARLSSSLVLPVYLAGCLYARYHWYQSDILPNKLRQRNFRFLRGGAIYFLYQTIGMLFVYNQLNKDIEARKLLGNIESREQIESPCTVYQVSGDVSQIYYKSLLKIGSTAVRQTHNLADSVFRRQP